MVLILQGFARRARPLARAWCSDSDIDGAGHSAAMRALGARKKKPTVPAAAGKLAPVTAGSLAGGGAPPFQPSWVSMR